MLRKLYTGLLVFSLTTLAASESSIFSNSAEKPFWKNLRELEEMGLSGQSHLVSLQMQNLHTEQLDNRQFLSLLRIKRPLNSGLEALVDEWQIYQRIATSENLDSTSLYLLFEQEDFFQTPSLKKLVLGLHKQYPDTYNSFLKIKRPRPISKREVTEIFKQTPDLSEFLDGSFKDKPTMFMFCRQSREYPCLLVAKDSFHQPLRLKDGKIWSQPALGLSKYGLKFDRPNGNTPQGIYLVKGVMPLADHPLGYGKYRRVILNFIPESPNENLHRILLPTASQHSSWWKEATIARDLGRDFLRMHGTGRLNTDPSSSYYPHYPTSGCISQREGIYNSVEFTDQRKLLDVWMSSAGLDPSYENEENIAGLLFVINLNDERRAVKLSDLNFLFN